MRGPLLAGVEMSTSAEDSAPATQPAALAQEEAARVRKLRWRGVSIDRSVRRPHVDCIDASDTETRLILQHTLPTVIAVRIFKRI